MKIVINQCYGGFGISHEAAMRYFEIKGITVYPEHSKDCWGFWTYWTVSPENRPETKEGDAFRAMTMAEKREYNKAYSEQTVHEREIERNDPALIQAVEELGKKSWGEYAELAVVEIPDDIEWDIHEYDGMEHVAEKHRTWS